MSIFSKLLINLFCGFCISTAYAHSIENTTPENEDLFWSASGFVYFREFVDDNWQKDQNAVAVNVDVAYKNFRAATQISSINPNLPIRRASIEWSYPIIEHTELIITSGIFHRQASFHNNSSDNPGSSGTAILPFAGYNHRMQTGTFTSLVGHEVKLVHKLPNDDLISFRVTDGKMYIDDEKELHTYLLAGRHFPGIRIVATNGSNDRSIHYDAENVSIFASKTHYIGKSIVEVASPTNIAASNKFNQFQFDSNRIGVRLSNKTGWVQAEHVRDHATYKNNKNIIHYDLLGKTWYVIAGLFIDDNYSVYVGRTNGTSITTRREDGKDMYVGITRETGDYAFTLEYHSGYGTPWMKYGSLPPHKWNSMIVSGTYRF